RQRRHDGSDQCIDALAGVARLDGEAMLGGVRDRCFGVAVVVELVVVDHSPSMPYWRSFFHSVVRLMRSRAAALVFWPSHSSRTRRMWARSSSSSDGTWSPVKVWMPAVGAAGRGPATSVTSSTLPVARITARSIAFSSSRTLPGHGWAA